MTQAITTTKPFRPIRSWLSAVLLAGVAATACAGSARTDARSPEATAPSSIGPVGVAQ